MNNYMKIIINAIKEWVSTQIPEETTPEDIIEWMGQESVITPLASTSGQVYLTNDNKILII